MTCPLFTGVFLVRACGAAISATCERCGRGVCGEHMRTRGRPPAAVRVRCVDCLRSSSSTRDDDDDVFIAGTTSGSPESDGGSAEAFSGDGGEFGGGGATGTWDDADASAAAGIPGADPTAFTPADFAAFDAISDSDKDQGSPGYDS